MKDSKTFWLTKNRAQSTCTVFDDKPTEQDFEPENYWGSDTGSLANLENIQLIALGLPVPTQGECLEITVNWALVTPWSVIEDSDK